MPLLAGSAIFEHLDAASRAFVGEHLEAQTVPAGTVLMRQGEPADSLYLVALGRLRVVVTHDDGTAQVVAELGRGDVVGEMALVADEPRSATVTALRDSSVLRLSREVFAELVERDPAVLRLVTTEAVRRLVHTLREGNPSRPVTTLAIVPLGADPALADWGRRLQRVLRRSVATAELVTRTAAEADLGALGTPGQDDSHRLARWFAEQEPAADLVCYLADHEPTPWAEACVHHADLVLLVGNAGEDPSPRPVEQLLATTGARTELVLLHPSHREDPRGTRRWLDPRSVDRHHHVRVDREADVERVGRLVRGRGIGLVLSGGGARGLAGIGVLRALEEHGVPVDACGGTSIGSIVAGGAARGMDPAAVVALMRAAVVDTSPFDVTFPVVSLAAGRRVTRRIREAAAGLDLEDAWRSLFAVSANLTTGGVHVHRRGPGWHALRASFSVPGVFPPVRSAEGDLLVDGGVLDNLPVGVMRGEHDGITVIAVDVTRARDLTGGSLPAGGAVSGWSLLLERLRARRPEAGAGLGGILMRVAELGGDRGGDRGDVCVRPAVDDFGIADFKAIDQLVELGRGEAGRVLDEWLSGRGRF